MFGTVDPGEEACVNPADGELVGEPGYPALMETRSAEMEAIRVKMGMGDEAAALDSEMVVQDALELGGSSTSDVSQVPPLPASLPASGASNLQGSGELLLREEGAGAGGPGDSQAQAHDTQLVQTAVTRWSATPRQQAAAIRTILARLQALD